MINKKLKIIAIAVSVIFALLIATVLPIRINKQLKENKIISGVKFYFAGDKLSKTSTIKNYSITQKDIKEFYKTSSADWPDDYDPENLEELCSEFHAIVVFWSDVSSGEIENPIPGMIEDILNASQDEQQDLIEAFYEVFPDLIDDIDINHIIELLESINVQELSLEMIEMYDEMCGDIEESDDDGGWGSGSDSELGAIST